MRAWAVAQVRARAVVQVRARAVAQVRALGGVVEHQHTRDNGRGGGTYTETVGRSAVERELVGEDRDDCARSERGEEVGGVDWVWTGWA